MNQKRKIEERPPGCSRRYGFTLVEVLMVISLIGLLLTIFLSVFGNAMVSSKEKATAATISKIYRILQQRKEAFERMNMKDAAAKLVSATAGGSIAQIPDAQTAEVIVRKQRFQMAFPQRVEERSVYNGLNYNAYFSGLSPRSPIESSALLYLSITQGETFGAAQVDSDAFTTREVKSTPITIGGNQIDLKYFVDAWGEPLRFYRCPSQLFIAANLPNAKMLISPLPSITMRDPDDPTNRFSLYYQSLSGTQQTSFNSLSKLNFTPGIFHTPLLISAGPDRKLGLLEPNDSGGGLNCLGQPSATAVADLPDDISNMNQRSKGN